jgi:hypothetical protein
VPAVFAAIRAGRVRVVTAPLRPLGRLRGHVRGLGRDLRRAALSLAAAP